MGAPVLKYEIVGRYMSGNEVTGYHLLCMDANKNGKYTKEQVCFLTGKGAITNCTGQLYKDKVLLRGVGISLDDLPVEQDNGSLKRVDGTGRIKKGSSNVDIITQVNIVKAIVIGRATVGYVVQNRGGGYGYLYYNQAVEKAMNGGIGNARAQLYNGKRIMRGIGTNLNELPKVTPEQLGIDPKKFIAKMKSAE